LSFELAHLLAGAVHTFFAFFWGIYAIRSLRLLHGTPEVLKTQRCIWMPILIGGIFFTIGGILHFAEHIALFVYQPFEEISDLLYDIFIVIGYTLLTVSVFRYWRLQKEYNEAKHRASLRLSRDD
jgi:hypothetical protein